jgi:hypothetical protein
MARLSIEIPDELRRKMEARRTETGHASLEDYVQWLLLEDADAVDYGAPDGMSVRSRAHLEEMVQEALSSPSREMTASDWDDMRRRLIQRQSESKAG